MLNEKRTRSVISTAAGRDCWLALGLYFKLIKAKLTIHTMSDIQNFMWKRHHPGRSHRNGT